MPSRKSPIRRHLLRTLAPLATLLAFSACVSPPLSGGPTADQELETVLRNLNQADRRAVGAELRALSLDHPRHVSTILADAVLSLEEGRTARGRSLLETVLRLEPDHVDAVALATRESTRSGDLAGAHRRLDAALQQKPDEPLLYESRAATYFVEGRYAEALQALDRADALAGSATWRSEFHRGLIAEAQGQTDAAIALFARCQELAPDYEPAGRHRRALEALQ